MQNYKAPTHLEYPHLGYESRMKEGEASNAAWDEIAAQLGSDVVHDTALYDFPSDLVRVSATRATVMCYAYGYAKADNKTKLLVRIDRESYGWSVVGAV